MTRFCRIAPGVSLGNDSGSTSWSVLLWFGLRARLLLSTNAELLGHQAYKCRCYLNRPACSCMWVWPLCFPKTIVRIIQSQGVSYDGWRAHGFRIDDDWICFPKIPHGFLVKKSTLSSCPKFALLGSNKQAGPYLSGLACRPRIAFQHLLNCCLTNKVAPESLHTLIRLRAANVNRLLKGSGSGASSSFDGDARSSTYTLRALVKVPKWRASAG